MKKIMDYKNFELEGKQPFFLLTKEDLDNFALHIIDGVREVIDEALNGDTSKKNDELISMDEVLEQLKVSKSTLWRWEKEQYLTPVKLGRKKYYRPSDIQNIKK